MTSQMLEQLEAQVSKLPPDAVKHDMEPGFSVMAQWIQALDGVHRAEVLSELPTWLRDDHRWHSRAAMEISWRVGDQQLLEAAIIEARARGVHDEAAGMEYPPWLIFHLYLLSTVSSWPGDPGSKVRTYLSDLRAGVSAKSYSRRLLAIRAWFTECLVGEEGQRKECLRQGLAELRKWGDARLERSGLSLLHAYFGYRPEGIADLKELLTNEEFAIAFSGWSQTK